MEEALVAGAIDISDNVATVTVLVLDEIPHLGIKPVTDNGKEITVSPDNFKCY